MAVWSAPRAGGELSSAPTTENRKRAQRAAVEVGDVGVMRAPRETDETGKRTVTSVLRPACRGSPGAWSADRGRPSGERAPQGSRNRDRCEEAKQSHPVIAVGRPEEEGIEE